MIRQSESTKSKKIKTAGDIEMLVSRACQDYLNWPCEDLLGKLYV